MRIGRRKTTGGSPGAQADQTIKVGCRKLICFSMSYRSVSVQLSMFEQIHHVGTDSKVRTNRKRAMPPAFDTLEEDSPNSDGDLLDTMVTERRSSKRSSVETVAEVDLMQVHVGNFQFWSFGSVAALNDCIANR